MLLPNFKVSLVDETEFWSEDMVKATGKIGTVYLWDDNRRQHICSFQPTIEGYFLDTWVENAVNMEDEILDKIQVENQQATELVDYFDPHMMLNPHQLIEYKQVSQTEWQSALEDCDGNEEDAYKQLVDEAIEDLQANPVW